MIKLKIILFFFIMSIVHMYVSLSEAYDNDFVHQMINGNAAQQALNFQSGIKNLGIKSIYDSINKKEVWQWFYDGAKLEDVPDCRSRNHFHDPIKPWNSSGLNSEVINAACYADGETYSVDSSIIWAQKQSSNLYSWGHARQYYYEALISDDNSTREAKLANTFRSIGQVMHLLADSSVPEHVRNDIHILPYTFKNMGITVGTPTYETWTMNHYDKLNYAGVKVDPLIFKEAISNSMASIPITALWDQDKYQGSMPAEWVPYSGQMVGLAEYTNANFFSKDTTTTGMFDTYPHPSLVETNFFDIKLSDLEMIYAEDGVTDRKIYISIRHSMDLSR